jgi:diguanylate cyclase (GGDEF)-like protein
MGDDDWLEDRDTLVEDLGKIRARSRAASRDRAWLTLLTGDAPGTIYRLENDELVIGRGTAAQIRLQSDALSRQHARIFRDAGAVYVEDLRSANGTYLNGQRLVEKTALRDGDRIELGQSTIFKFSLQDELEEKAVIKVYNSSVRDPLIGIYNRQYFDDRLVGEFSFAKRNMTSLSVLMIDVDHFKSVNDTYGHQVGDAVLKVVGNALTRITRTEDVLARYGGEEFVMIARALSARNALILGERLRRNIEVLRLPLGEKSLQVTASVGVATHSDDRVFSSASALVAAADAALYAAKRSGRNRVVGE